MSNRSTVDLVTQICGFVAAVLALVPRFFVNNDKEDK